MGKYTSSVCTMIVALALSFVLSWILDISGFSLWGDTFQKVCYIIMRIITLLLEAVLSIGLTYYFFQMALGNPHSVKQLFYCFTHDPDRYILAAALRYGLVLIGFIPAAIYYYRIPSLFTCTTDQLLILLGLVLLAALLNLPVLLYFGQSYYILLDDANCSVWESMKRSCELMKGQKKRLFLLYLSFIGYSFLEIGTLSLGTLWIRPYLEMIQVQFYLDLIGRDPIAEAAARKAAAERPIWPEGPFQSDDSFDHKDSI